MLLVGNGRLITRDPDKPYADEGCVAIKGREIAELGKTEALRAKYRDAEFIDARGGIIMPGFINAHMHFYSTFSRGMTPPGAPSPRLCRSPGTTSPSSPPPRDTRPCRW